MDAGRSWFSVRGLLLLAAVVGAPPAAARAAITSTGLVTPSPVTASNPTVELRIGVGNNPEDVDPRASVTVNGGSTLSYDQVFVGYDIGFFGRFYVNGAGTVAQFHQGGTNSDAAVEVGRKGRGYMEVTAGATINFTSNSADMVVGSDAGALGELLIDGAETFITVPEDILVGDAGAGTLTLTNGAYLRTRENGSVVTIGDKAGGYGAMYVDGRFTTFQPRHNLNVGGLGIGELHIGDEAIVDADNTSTAQATVGTLGSVYLSGGTLYVRDINVSGYLGGAGVVRGQVDVLSAGDVEVNAGQLLRFENAFNNSGAVTITGGELRLQGTNSNSATGRYTLEDGVVRFYAGLTNAGVLASADGVNNIHGAVTNNGAVVVASESVAVFNDSYTDNGTTTVLARGNALFLRDLTFTSNSLLSLQVTDASGGNAPGQIQVGGAATLAGELALAFDPAFDFASSTMISLLYADGGISGSFIPPVFPTVEGVDFGLVYGANSVSLSVSVDTGSLLDGDFNGDGTVNAADYTVWRDGLGTVYSQEDYQVWFNNYGQSNGVAQNAPAQAPSPSGLATALTAAACATLTRRRRTAQQPR